MSPTASMPGHGQMWEGPPGPDPAALPPDDDRPAARSAPWWAVSIAFHAVLLIVATIWIVGSSALATPVLTTIVIRTRPDEPDLDFTKNEVDPKTKVKIDVPEVRDPMPDVPRLVKPEVDIDSTFDETFSKKEGPAIEIPWPNPAPIAAIGVGPGGGNPFGRPGRGGDETGGPPRGRPPEEPGFDDAVLRALRWLARHQSDDGGWSCAGFSRECGRAIRDGGTCGGPGYAEYDTGVTGLALLAFLGAGYTPASTDTHDGIRFGSVIAKGLRRLAETQDPDGRIGGGTSAKPMYNHAIAALALAEGYGMTSAPLLRDPAQRAIDWLVRAQNPYKAWRYTEKSGDNDTSVAGWAVMALKSADISGLDVPKGAYDGARAWVDEVTGDDFRAGYTERGTGKVAVQGKNERYDHHEALTAAAMLIRAFTGARRDDPRLRGGTALLAADLPAHDGWRTDYYYWYYGSLALFQVDGATGPSWKRWVANLEKALLPTQRTRQDGCAFGSWDTNERWCFEGGRVYATAINALTLEVNYRYKNVFGVR